MDTITLYLIFGLAFLLVLFLFGFLKNQPISDDDLKQKYVSRDAFEALQNHLAAQKFDLADRDEKLLILSGHLAGKEELIRQLEDRLAVQKTDLTEMNERFKMEFENLANRLLDEKGRQFSLQNEQQLTGLLIPLRERIRDFEGKMAHQFLEETRERSSLKKEIEQLRDLNSQLSHDANNLANALKGQSKLQGDWGEFQLELLLEKSGLSKGLHFQTQTQFSDEKGEKRRPDFIINLPGGRQLIIDSKVSLTAFERWFNEADETRKKQHLKAHVESLRMHVAGLSGKNYPSLYQINSPDYLLLFVPLDSALSVALHQEPRLFTDAMEKNVVLVTTSTLLATMRTVGYLWKQEKQTRSVQEIARQSGLLFDKFVAFVDDLRVVGQRMDAARSSYDEAMNKLTDSKREGVSIIARAEKIRELGAKSTRQLPKEMVETALERAGVEDSD